MMRLWNRRRSRVESCDEVLPLMLAVSPARTWNLHRQLGATRTPFRRLVNPKRNPCYRFCEMVNLCSLFGYGCAEVRVAFSVPY